MTGHHSLHGLHLVTLLLLFISGTLWYTLHSGTPWYTLCTVVCPDTLSALWYTLVHSLQSGTLWWGRVAESHSHHGSFEDTAGEAGVPCDNPARVGSGLPIIWQGQVDTAIFCGVWLE